MLPLLCTLSACLLLSNIDRPETTKVIWMLFEVWTPGIQGNHIFDRNPNILITSSNCGLYSNLFTSGHKRCHLYYQFSIFTYLLYCCCCRFSITICQVRLAHHNKSFLYIIMPSHCRGALNDAAIYPSIC